MTKENETFEPSSKEKREMSGPRESKKLLMEYIGANGGISLKDAIEFEKRREIWFGPNETVLDVLTKKQALGYIDIDEKTHKFKLTSNRKHPVYQIT